MQVHRFHAAVAPYDECEQMVGGKVCGDAPQDRVHQLIAEYGCYYPIVTVQVFLRKTPGPVGSVHYATVAFQAENDNSWFSAWCAPHNDPSSFSRLEALDAESIEEMGEHIKWLIEAKFTEVGLNAMGIKS